MKRPQTLFEAESSLYFGDNLAILPKYLRDESIDLIYLDPPFNSNKSYSAIFKHVDGTPADAQIKAFEDSWRWSLDSARTFKALTEESTDSIAGVMRAFEAFVGKTDMLAYLVMMAPRLIELRRVLKPTGSIYLHCDPTASHYLKLLLDAIFGHENFVNEVVWHYRKWPAGKTTFQRNHDVILFYSRSRDKARTFNQLYMERAASTKKRFGTARIESGHDSAGNRVPSKTGSEQSEGVRMDDVWGIGRVPPVKQFYPTQKPLALLERIITASSNPGDVVLDPFCGCGTAVHAAQQLDRVWIGIDITSLAIDVIRDRLNEHFPDLGYTGYSVGGIPPSPDEVAFLAKFNKFAFQQRACDVLGSEMIVRPGRDRGVDGRVAYQSDIGPWTAIISVKGGKTGPGDVRELCGTVAREGANAGVFVTVNTPTPEMRREAIQAGDAVPGIPKIQILTGADLVRGKLPLIPSQAPITEIARARRAVLRRLRPIPSTGEA